MWMGHYLILYICVNFYVRGTLISNDNNGSFCYSWQLLYCFTAKNIFYISVHRNGTQAICLIFFFEEGAWLWNLFLKNEMNQYYNCINKNSGFNNYCIIFYISCLLHRELPCVNQKQNYYFMWMRHYLILYICVNFYVRGTLISNDNNRSFCYSWQLLYCFTAKNIFYISVHRDGTQAICLIFFFKEGARLWNLFLTNEMNQYYNRINKNSDFNNYCIIFNILCLLYRELHVSIKTKTIVLWDGALSYTVYLCKFLCEGHIN